MTTTQDWLDRSSYLRDAAGRLQKQAANLNEEAGRLYALAYQCDLEAEARMPLQQTT